MSSPETADIDEGELVFLIDVDNTLLDNDRIQADIREHLAATYGTACRDRYAAILEQLWLELGYRDYLGALQRYRVEHVRTWNCWPCRPSSSTIPSPSGCTRMRWRPSPTCVAPRRWSCCPTATWCSSRARCSARALPQAVDGQVLIYIHKELALDEVQRRHPARHYVLIDDKLRILSAVKQRWQQRVSTVFVRQGSYAHDGAAIAGLPAADHCIEHIADLLAQDVRELASTPRRG